MAATKKKSKRRPATRGGRAAHMQRERVRRSLVRRLVFAGVLIALVFGVLFTSFRNGSGNGNSSSGSSGSSSSKTCHEDTTYDSNSREHVPDPTYKVNPPAGGAHLPVPAPPGFYGPGNTEPVPPDGALVHAMEHGFVVLWYKPSLPAPDLQKVQALSDRFGRPLIVAARDSLSGPVAVTSWHHRLLCTAIDADAIASFVEGHVDKGPEKGFM